VRAAADRATEAVELARLHGWAENPLAAVPYAVVANAKLLGSHVEDAGPWIDLAERAMRPELHPAAAQIVLYARAVYEALHGRVTAANAAFRKAENAARLLAEGSSWLPRFMWSEWVHHLVRLGAMPDAVQKLADASERYGDCAEVRVATAVVTLSEGKPEAARSALAPVLNGEVLMPSAPLWPVLANVLEANALEDLGDPASAHAALERALHHADASGALLPLVYDAMPAIVARHEREGTAHAALLSRLRSRAAVHDRHGPQAEPQPLIDALTASEVRILRYLPTNLSAPEIARELYLSVHTIRTHTRHIYDKLGTHDRTKAVNRARELGLLAPAPPDH